MENNAEDDDISAQTPPEQCRAHFAHPNCITIQISTLRVRFTKSNKHYVYICKLWIVLPVIHNVTLISDFLNHRIATYVYKSSHQN